MKFMIVAALAFAVANASVIPSVGNIAQEIIAPIATSAVVQGPSTRTQVVGPDGSQIIADAPGGTIVTNEQAAVAAVAAIPVVAADPVVEVAAPILAKAITPLVQQVGTPIIANTLVEQVGTPVVAAPLVAKTLVASPVAADGYPLLAPGSGLEGQYIPDNIEKQYDDGSYKGEAVEEH